MKASIKKHIINKGNGHIIFQVYYNVYVECQKNKQEEGIQTVGGVLNRVQTFRAGGACPLGRKITIELNSLSESACL